MKTLKLLLKAVTEKFAEDKTKPDVVLSYLDDQDVFYISITRYSLPYGEGKKVVMSVKSKTVTAAAKQISWRFLGGKDEAARQLRDHLEAVGGA